MSAPIQVDAAGARETFAAWLARGDAIVMFQNADLSHPNVGHRIFLPLSIEEVARVEVGVTRAPDGAHGLGWRYVLEGIERGLEGFSFVGGPKGEEG